MRLAALDLGSNSFHLLVADRRPGGRIKRVETKKITIRLAEGVEATGGLGPDGQERAAGAFAELLEVARDRGARSLVAVGTAALRRAHDSAEWRGRMLAEHGVDVQVVTGLDEAALSLRGAAAALNLDAEEAVLGVDLGGGSLEIAYGTASGVVAAVSLELGAAVMSARLGEPPRLRDVVALHEHSLVTVGAVVDKLTRHFDGDLPRAVATAGTIRDLARLGLALASGSAPQRVRGLVVTRGQIERAWARLCSYDVVERMDLPGVSSKRADLLPAGGVVVLATMEALGLEQLQLSDWGLREGALLDVVGPGHLIDLERMATLANHTTSSGRNGQ